MNCAIEGMYKDGNIELGETPEFKEPVDVLVVFLENQKKVRKLGGLFKNLVVLNT